MQNLVMHLGAARMMAEMADCIREDFLRWEDFDKSPRTANHSVNGHPRNPLQGLTTTTAMRTAATSVVAAKALARPDSTRMALIGNGSQSEFQAIAFLTQLGIRELRVFDVDSAATDKLIANLAPFAKSGELKIVRAASIREAVRGADIVTTVTADKTNATILTDDLVEPGMHLNPVGGDCPGMTELQPSILLRSKVLAGTAHGRDDAQQVTLFDSVGFALEDLSALRYIHQLSLKLVIGSTVDLVPTLRDPKDLFGCATAARPPLRKAA